MSNLKLLEKQELSWKSFGNLFTGSSFLFFFQGFFLLELLAIGVDVIGENDDESVNVVLAIDIEMVDVGKDIVWSERPVCA